MPAIDIGTFSTTTSLTNLIRTYYDRMLLETLDPECLGVVKLRKFGGSLL